MWQNHLKAGLPGWRFHRLKWAKLAQWGPCRRNKYILGDFSDLAITLAIWESLEKTQIPPLLQYFRTQNTYRNPEFWWSGRTAGSCGAIWAFKGAAPLKGLSTFCNSLESAIFPKLRTKCKVSFFTHQRAKWHQNLWVIPTQPSNEWTLNKNFHLTVSPFT